VAVTKFKGTLYHLVSSLWFNQLTSTYGLTLGGRI
jgi:hypothetical protein